MYVLQSFLTWQTFTALCLVGYYIPSPIGAPSRSGVSLWTRQKPYGQP
jgi:hypothetical protein